MRLPKMDQWELVQFEWVDSAGPESGWHKPGKKEMEIHGCVTVGQLYAQSSDRVVVVLSRDSTSKNVDGIITIPTVAITAYARLKQIPKP
jgi:hypothetical protein